MNRKSLLSFVLVTMLSFVLGAPLATQAATISVVVRSQDVFGTKVGRPFDIGRRSNNVWIYTDQTDQYDSQPANLGRIMQVNSAGVLTVIANIGEIPYGIYVASSSTAFVMGRSGTLYRINLNTGGVTTVAVGVTTANFESRITGRQISGSTWELYVGETNLARIMKVNSSTGTVSVLFSGMVPHGLTMDGNDIMAVESFFGVGYLGRINTSSGLLVGGWTTFAGFSPRSLAQRSGNRYWTINGFDGGLYEINTAGGVPLLRQASVGGFVPNISENHSSSQVVTCDQTTRTIGKVTGLP